LCRRFHLLLRPLIFKKIAINVSLNPAKCVLLLHTLKENPDLSQIIHLFDISWSDADADTGDHERANELLGALLYVRELSIKADWDKIPFQPRFLSANALTGLKIISILDPPTQNRQYAKVHGP
jgi:hypothetical protein